MDSPTFYEGSQTIKNGLRCGTQLAIIFHHPVSAEVTSTIREATTALNKVLSLLQDDNASTTKGNGSSLFSLQGLEYAKLLIVDCGAALLKLETMVRDASLGEAHLMKKHHQDQEASQTEKKLDLDMLSFSVRNLLEPSEAAPWTQAFESLEICLGRLYELQHRLHLVTTRALSRDLPSGEVDVKILEAYHAHVIRIADIVGVPTSSVRAWHSGFESSDSIISSSAPGPRCDDAISVSLRPKRSFIKAARLGRPARRNRGPAPPAPELACPPGCIDCLGRPLADGSTPSISSVPGGIPSIINISAPNFEAANPPAYSRAPQSETSKGSEPYTKPSAALDAKPVDGRSQQLSGSALFQAENGDEAVHDEKVFKSKSESLKPRLFRSNPSNLSFKIKSFLRTKQSLAEEMQQTLSESDSQLRAYIIRGHELRTVPRSTFHSLESTHLRDILSQLNGDAWYKTFATLNDVELESLGRVLHPQPSYKTQKRDLLVLKVAQQSKNNALLTFAKKLLCKDSVRQEANGRAILAIVCVKGADRKIAEYSQTTDGSATPGDVQTRPSLRPRHSMLCYRRQSRLSEIAAHRCPPPAAPAVTCGKSMVLASMQNFRGVGLGDDRNSDKAF